MESELEHSMEKKPVRHYGPRGPNREYIYACETYDEIARKIGITKQAVQKIEKKALVKLRMECEKRGWNFANMMEDLIEARQLKDRRNAQFAGQDADEFDDIRVSQTCTIQ